MKFPSWRGPGHRLSLTPLVLLGAAVISGCDSVLDCLDKDGPVFNTSVLAPATLNQEYNQEIGVSIENEPFDDRFIYEFNLISGTLPPGIDTRSITRTFTLSGTATELGSYNFKLNVEVDDGLSPAESGLCYRSRSRNFILEVVQDNS